MEISEVEKLKLEENDTLVVSVDSNNYTSTQLEHIANECKKFFPDNKIMVIPAGYTLTVIPGQYEENKSALIISE